MSILLFNTERETRLWSIVFSSFFSNWKISNNLWICYAFEIELKYLRFYLCCCCSCSWSFWKGWQWEWVYSSSILSCHTWVLQMCDKFIKKETLHCRVYITFDANIYCIIITKNDKWNTMINTQHLLYTKRFHK